MKNFNEIETQPKLRNRLLNKTESFYLAVFLTFKCNWLI